MLKRYSAIAALAALGACGCAPPDGAPAERGVYASIPAPTREDVAVRVTAADHEGRIEIPTGGLLAVELIGIPTAGYEWRPVQVPDYLEAEGVDGGPTSQAQLEPGFTGGSHWEVYYFRAAAPGEGELSFEQSRPWETDTDPIDTFVLTVVAGPRNEQE